MSYDNRLELVVDIDAGPANAALGSVGRSLSVMEQQAITTARAMSTGMDRSQADITKAAQAAQMLSAKLGLGLPEAAARAMAANKLLGTAMQAVWGGAVIGAAISSAAVLIGKIYEWSTATSAAEKASEELNASLSKQRDELKKLQEAYSLYGFKGAALTEEEARRGLERTQQQLLMLRTAKGALEASSPKELTKEELLTRARWGVPYTPYTNPNQSLIDETQGSIKLLEMQERKYRAALMGPMRDLIEEHKSANKKITDNANAERERELKSYIDNRRQLEREAAESMARIIVLDKEASAIRIATDNAARDALTRRTGIVSYATGETPEEQIAAGLRKNEETGRQILENYAKELKATEAVKKAQEDMARETQRAYEKAADAIEGFVHRTFLTAKSFSDVWKQALAQVADYAVRQFARMAAAAWMGGGRAAPGAAMAGGSVLGIPSIMGPLLGGGGMGGSGGDVLGGTIQPGGFGSQLFQGGFAQMAAMAGGGMLLSHGLSNKNPFTTVGGSAALGYSLGPTLGSSIGLSGLGGGLAGAGIGLTLAGYQRGGASGFGMSVGGGALTGFALGGPIGAIIGAVAGAIVGLVGILHKSAVEKAREKIKACYGVDIQDRGVLKQVVDLAKQSFGGNLDMAIRSNVVQDLVRLYAMTTGQGTSGLRAPMSSLTMSQSGGGLYALPSYSNGLPGSGLSSISVGAAAGASGGGVTVVNNITIDSNGAQRFLEGSTLTTINKYPRAVQSATATAIKSNYGRREGLALQLSPGTLVS